MLMLKPGFLRQTSNISMQETKQPEQSPRLSHFSDGIDTSGQPLLGGDDELSVAEESRLSFSRPERAFKLSAIVPWALVALLATLLALEEIRLSRHISREISFWRPHELGELRM